MKTLLVDIETFPHTAYVWGIWQENIGTHRLIETGGVLCWTAKWFGEKEVHFSSMNSDGQLPMLQKLHALLTTADEVVTYNGERFDLPILNMEFLKHNLSPPPPIKSIDLFRTVKRKFRFVSNKLTYITTQLGLGKKIETSFSLWTGCMEGDPKAWAKMEAYNKKDVLLLERLYLKLRPWIASHSNRTLNEAHVCPVCGHGHYQKRGFYLTKAQKYQRFQCKRCASWFRAASAEKISLDGKHYAI